MVEVTVFAGLDRLAADMDPVPQRLNAPRSTALVLGRNVHSATHAVIRRGGRGRGKGGDGDCDAGGSGFDSRAEGGR